MTYNYFNAGRLAFGKKITSAFNSLNQLLSGATEHVQEVADSLAYYNSFSSKNYLCPEPITPYMPARTDEIFHLVDDFTYFNNVSTDGTTTTFNLTLFDKTASRITVASGTTTIKKGYAFVKLSTSLDNFNKTIRFSEVNDQNEGEVFICKFYVEGTDIFIDKPNESDLSLTLGEQINYRSLSADWIASGSYTCNKRAECVLVTGTGGSDSHDIDIRLNGTPIFYIHSLGPEWTYVILYLKEGDVVSGGTVGDIYRVSYNK